MLMWMRQHEEKIRRVTAPSELWSSSDTFHEVQPNLGCTSICVDSCSVIPNQNTIEVDDKTYLLYKEFGCILPSTVYAQAFSAVETFLSRPSPELEVLKYLCLYSNTAVTSKSLQFLFTDVSNVSTIRIGQVMRGLVDIGLVERWYVGRDSKRAWHATKLTLNLNSRGIFTKEATHGITELQRLKKLVDQTLTEKPSVEDIGSDFFDDLFGLSF